MLLPCDVDPMIQNAEVEASFNRFSLFPGNGHEHRIHVHLGDPGKDSVCLRYCPCGRISQLPSQDLIGLPVDDQLTPLSRLRDRRHLSGVCHQRA